MNARLILSAELPISLADPMDRARLHAGIDAFLDACEVAGVTASVSNHLAPTPPTGPPLGRRRGAAVRGDRQLLTPPELEAFLRQLASGAAGGKPLNESERLMLTAIAVAEPRPLTFDNQARILGSGQKSGSTSSSLARRFWSRGYELPYEPDDDHTGYVMDAASAEVVMLVLGNDRTDHDHDLAGA